MNPQYTITSLDLTYKFLVVKWLELPKYLRFSSPWILTNFRNIFILIKLNDYKWYNNEKDSEKMTKNMVVKVVHAMKKHMEEN
jgi:hypothetical protein